MGKAKRRLLDSSCCLGLFVCYIVQIYFFVCSNVTVHSDVGVLPTVTLWNISKEPANQPFVMLCVFGEKTIRCPSYPPLSVYRPILSSANYVNPAAITWVCSVTLCASSVEPRG